MKEITINRTKILQKEGVEITSYIAGINSGFYELPYIIEVRTWAKKWWLKKFYFYQIKLNIHEIKKLKEECENAINLYNIKNNR